jgi:hypothetical protein
MLTNFELEIVIGKIVLTTEEMGKQILSVKLYNPE